MVPSNGMVTWTLELRGIQYRPVHAIEIDEGQEHHDFIKYEWENYPPILCSLGLKSALSLRVVHPFIRLSVSREEVDGWIEAERGIDGDEVEGVTIGKNEWETHFALDYLLGYESDIPMYGTFWFKIEPITKEEAYA